MSKMNSLYVGQPIENLLEIKEFYTFFEDVLPPHYKSIDERHDFYEAFVIYEGKVRVIVDNDSFYMKKGQLYVYTPGVFHSICNDDETDCYLQIMSFSAKSFPQTKGIYNLSQERIDELKQMASSFHECLMLLSLRDIRGDKFTNFNTGAFVRGIESQRELDTSVLKKKLEIFLLEVLSSNNTSTPIQNEESKDALSIILSTLKDNLYSRITTTEIAKITLMSVPYIEKTIHEYLGIGVMKYYNIMKMQEALNLLSKGNSVKNVSNILGFTNQNYFSTVFNKHFGFPPSNVKNHSIHK